jgi:hypothetical protein
LRESLFRRLLTPHAGEGGLDLLLETGDQFAIGGLGTKSFSRRGAKTQREEKAWAVNMKISF